MIRAGMTVAEAILQLTKGFRKMMGRDPDGLEKIKIQQEAAKRIEEVNKVVDMEGNVIDTSKGIMGGKQIQDSPEFGARIRETYDKAKGPGKGREMVDAMKSPGARKSYEIIEDQLGVKLYGDETFEEILEIQRTGKHPRGEPSAKSLKEELMKTDNPFSDLVKTTEKGPKSLEQRRKEAEEALKNKNVVPFKDPEGKADGGRAGFDNGGAPNIKLFPRASGRQVEGEVGPGLKISERDLNYGITGLLQGDKFFGGAELDKGKVKIDVVTPEGDTLFKDTMGKKDAVNFILGMGDPKGEKFQIKTDKNFENIQFVLQKSFAQGGIARLGLKQGSGMTRRTFLKLLGGMAAIPIVGKFLKPMKVGKTITKVPVIKTDDVAGKPEWFDALVNKVITEGDDVTKRFATGERQSIHQKTLDDGSVVRVTEDVDDGAVRVEYESDANVFEDPVQLQYKKPLPDEGDPRPSAEFTTAESGPVGRAYGPDDYEIDVDEVGGTSIRDLDSDVSKLKEYATGQKPTMKELVQNIERKKKARRITEDPEAQSDAVIARQGEALDYDDYASGGIARMLGE